MPPSKADLRSWCRERYGADWHATDKSNRLAEANAALSTSTAATPAPAAPPAASQPAPLSAASASAPDLRAWCRQRYGNDWHSTDKTARLAEARAALASGDDGAKQASKELKQASSGAAKRPAPEGSEAKQPAKQPKAKEPKRTLEDALKAPGSGKAYVALMQVQRAWNVLDYSDEMQVTMVGGSMAMVPLYYDTHERDEMLQLMKEQVQTGGSSYENPFGADDTEALLEAFAELSVDQQRRLHAIAKRCVKAGTTITDDDVVEVLDAK